MPMSDKLLRKKEIAAMLGTSPDVAASILAKHGLHPIDLGMGRSRGLRWLESAVLVVLRVLHQEAQPKPRIPRKPHASSIPQVSLKDMNAKDVHELLTGGQCVQ